MQKHIFDISIVDTEADHVAFCIRVVASDVKAAADKAVTQADSEKILVKDKHYHVHIVSLGQLPNPSGIVVPGADTLKNLKVQA